WQFAAEQTHGVRAGRALVETAALQLEQATADHIAQVCKEAGLDVMRPILALVHDRENVPDSTLFALTADDVTDLYETRFAPAVDAVEDDLNYDTDENEGE